MTCLFRLCGFCVHAHSLTCWRAATHTFSLAGVRPLTHSHLLAAQRTQKRPSKAAAAAEEEPQDSDKDSDDSDDSGSSSHHDLCDTCNTGGELLMCDVCPRVRRWPLLHPHLPPRLAPPRARSLFIARRVGVVKHTASASVKCRDMTASALAG
jgi:hypothetical protein